jgi:hypothetical protein
MKHEQEMEFFWFITGGKIWLVPFFQQIVQEEYVGWIGYPVFIVSWILRKPPYKTFNTYILWQPVVQC